MNSPTSAQLLSALTDAELSIEELAQLREWVAAIRHSGECLALIEASAQGRGCPRCGASRVHRCDPAARACAESGPDRSGHAALQCPWPAQNPRCR